MSDTAGTIIKLLAALTSPRACVKYITVAIALLISWEFLATSIPETKIPKEQISIVILLLGVGCGSLIGEIFSWIYGSLWNKYKSNKEEALNQRIKKEEADLEKTKEEEKKNSF